MSAARRVVLVYNTTSYLARFRSELIAALIDRRCEVVALAPADAAVEQLRQLGVRCDDLRLNRYSANPLAELRNFLAVLGALRRHRPCTVLSFTIKPVIYASLAARWLGAMPAFSMITGLGSLYLDETWLGRARRRAVEWLYRLALARNRKVFFQNAADSERFLAARLVRPEQVVTIPGSGVNLDRFARHDRPQHSMTFVLVARLLREKGIAEFAAAARALGERYPQARFVIVGPFEGGPSGISHEEFDAMLRKTPVEYQGELDDIRPCLEAAGVFVLPTYYGEGTPRSILEALAMGMPVVTTDIPGCRETVEDGVNGFLVPARDSRRLADALERFLRNPSLVDTMGQRSRALAAERYDVHTVNAVIIDAMGL